MYLGYSEQLIPKYSFKRYKAKSSSRPVNPHFLGYSSNIYPKIQDMPVQNELKEHRYFNSPQVQDLKEAKSRVDTKKVYRDDSELREGGGYSVKNRSTSRKALNAAELEANKVKWKKPEKISAALKRKRFNQRLSKILAPKSALNLLHELKPGCTFDIQQQMDNIPPSYFVKVSLNGAVLGTGQGFTKTQARNLAAEDAIRNIVSRVLSYSLEKKDKDVEVGANPDERKEDRAQDLPWVGIASFAMYKMFNEWQNHGTNMFSIANNSAKKKFSTVNVNAAIKRDLPANANQLHPTMVLNMVSPGLTPVELERDEPPNCRVKVAYVVNGKMFCGEGRNKKDARKEAAKAVLEGLYGLRYC